MANEYSCALAVMIARMNDNLQLTKIELSNTLVSHIRSVTVHLEMLDDEHFQRANGVDDITIDGCASVESNDEISINPFVAEPGSMMQRFQMRQRCYLAGKVLFVLGGGKSAMFNIKPYQIGTQLEITLTATSNCDFDNAKTVQINIKLDSKKRISTLRVSNIKLSDFPGVRKELLSRLIGSLNAVHIDDVRARSNQLAFEYAKMALETPVVKEALLPTYLAKDQPQSH